jgi:NAD(P)-dependent dehydrogenase (short-subunit alcohol dehydrogenase family)
MAVVVVTGGSSGIGLAIVKRLAVAGDRVFAASRQPTRAALPDGVTPIELDVADSGSVAAAVARVVDAEGRIDVLVNNAGTISFGALEETADEEAHRVMEVNLFGPMRMVRAVLPVMREQGDGHIINVSSVNDVVPAMFSGWYSASKAALTSLSAVLDAEVHALGIRVTTVSPGLFESDMVAVAGEHAIADDSAYRRSLEALRAHNGRRTAGDPDDVAQVVDTCIRDADPRQRIVVGADGIGMDAYMRDTPPAEVTKLMRGLAAGLATS